MPMIHNYAYIIGCKLANAKRIVYGKPIEYANEKPKIYNKSTPQEYDNQPDMLGEVGKAKTTTWSDATTRPWIPSKFAIGHRGKA